MVNDWAVSARWGGLVAALLVACACDKARDERYQPTASPRAPAAAAAAEFVVGIHPLHNPQRLMAVYGPIVGAMNDGIPEARFRLEASLNYEDFEKKLYAGHFAFAMPNPYQTVRSLAHGYRVFAKMADDADFRGLILVRRDAGIHEVGDLRGKAVSYPAATALAATMMPQYFLQTHGLDVNRDIENRYVGSQESSIMNVLRGHVAAGATWPVPWKTFSVEHPELASQLEVKWQTGALVNNGWVVRQDVPPQVAGGVRARAAGPAGQRGGAGDAGAGADLALRGGHRRDLSAGARVPGGVLPDGPRRRAVNAVRAMNPLRRLSEGLHRAWSKSISRQLAWSFSLASLLAVLGAGLLLYGYERHVKYEESTQRALELAQTLSFASASAVLADDLAGLEEIVQGGARASDLELAVVVSPRGEVLACTRPAWVGQFLSDAVSQRLLRPAAGQLVLVDEPELVDVAVPIVAAGQPIGWVRVELNRETANVHLRRMAVAGLAIAALLAVMAVLIANRLAQGLTRGLERLAHVAIDAAHGGAFERHDVDRADEVGALARHLYQMLDTIDAERHAKSQSEARFRQLVQDLSIPLSYASQDGAVQYLNTRFEQAFGYTLAEVPTIGDWWRLAFPDEGYRQQVRERWNAALQVAGASGRDIPPGEYRVTCKNGDVRLMEISGVLFGGDQLAIFQDLTERKRAEEAVHASAQYVRSLIEASLDPLVTISADGKITDVNMATELVTGVGRAQLIGNDFADYFTSPQKARAGYQEVFSQGFVTDYPLTIRHVSGKVTEVLYNASVYRDGEGQIRGVFAVARDVTDLRRVEARRAQLAAMVESSNDAIFGKTPDGVITSWNKGAETIYGYTAEEIIGRNVTVLAAPSRHAEIRALLRRVAQGEVVANFESERVRKDGAVVKVDIALSPIHDAEGRITGVASIARDVTEKKRLEEELTHYKDHLEDEVQQRTVDLVLARDAAEAANRAKSVFLANMSHELRTPLNAILGFSSLLRQDAQWDAGQRDKLDIINRSGEHLLTLINDVLEMAKIEAGRLQLDSSPFDLGGMVRDVTDMMNVRAREKGLRLLIDQSSEFPRYIVGDEARLRQVLINLVGNAVKFTEQGGITVRLGVERGGAQPLLRMEVEDTGPGISPADRQRLFQPFVQLGQQAGDNKGTGLGLPISLQYARLMGGTIEMESTVGKGSLFRVELPLVEVQEADLIKAPGEVLGDVVGLAPGQPSYRVLIVEDQLENQLLLTQLMERLGLEVRVAANGERGVQLFQDWHPHLIWMDRRMPVLDGIDATRRIRALPGGREVKIVAVTASAFKEQRDEMLAAGMDDFVRKPYRFSEIYECLGRQLGVQFVRAEAPAGPGAGAETLRAEHLAGLPAALCRDLHDALETLDGERIGAVLAQIAPLDEALHRQLTRLAQNFDYPAILGALNANAAQRGPTA